MKLLKNKPCLTKYDRARNHADKECGKSEVLNPEHLADWDMANNSFLEGFNACENIIRWQLVEVMAEAIGSPTDFIYQLDRAIKSARISGASINDVQKYLIKCLLDSHGTVLTEPIYFNPF